MFLCAFMGGPVIFCCVSGILLSLMKLTPIIHGSLKEFKKKNFDQYLLKQYLIHTDIKQQYHSSSLKCVKISLGKGKKNQDSHLN